MSFTATEGAYNSDMVFYTDPSEPGQTSYMVELDVMMTADDINQKYPK